MARLARAHGVVRLPRGTATFTGRRVGLLTLGAVFRDTDGARWVEARCDCGTVTAVRTAHATPGARKPILSCGCLATGARRQCLAGRSAGMDVVVSDDGTDAVIVACPWGHAWTDARTKTHARVHTPSRSERTRSECPVCRVRVTVDMRGEVVGLLTVLRRAGTDARDGDPRGSQATWWVRCECGTEKTVRGAHLRRETHGVRTCGARECIRAWQGR